jgi:hypothetical protein
MALPEGSQPDDEMSAFYCKTGKLSPLLSNQI